LYSFVRFDIFKLNKTTGNYTLFWAHLSISKAALMHGLHVRNIALHSYNWVQN